MKRLQRGPAAVLVLLSGPALASVETVGGGVSLSQTRVVYLATDKAQLLTVKIPDSNTEPGPAFTGRCLIGPVSDPPAVVHPAAE